MKVLFVIHDAHGWAGTERVTNLIANGLSAYFEVEVLSLCPPHHYSGYPYTPDVKLSYLPLQGGIRHILGANVRILALGRLETQKRFDLLIDAFAVFARTHPEWSLRIRGSGSKEAGLRSKRAAYGLEDSVQILPPTQNVAEEYAGASRMGRLADDASLRRQMGAEARQDIRRYDIGPIIERWSTMLHALGDGK